MTSFLTERINPVQAQVEILKEGIEGKDLYLKGICLQGGVRNHNQRIYPVHEIAKSVEQLNEMLRNGEPILGEADHPEELTVSVQKASHAIVQIYMEGNNAIGKLKILDTEQGRNVRGILEGGIKLGVSSRGSGNVDGNGYVSDFEIVTVDIVARPSAPNAFPVPIYEALNYSRKGAGHIIEGLVKAAKHDPIARHYLDSELNKLAEQWVKHIESLKI